MRGESLDYAHSKFHTVMIARLMSTRYARKVSAIHVEARATEELDCKLYR
jgi:hypothetical protein